MSKLKKSSFFAGLSVCLLLPNAFAGTYVLQNTPTPAAAIIGPLTAGVNAPAVLPGYDEKNGVPASKETTYIWEWMPDNDDIDADPAPSKYVEHSFELNDGPILASYSNPADAGALVNFEAQISDGGGVIGSSTRYYDVFAAWSHSTPFTMQTNFPATTQTHQSLTMINPIGRIITSKMTVKTGESQAFAVAFSTTGIASSTIKGSIITTGASLVP